MAIGVRLRGGALVVVDEVDLEVFERGGWMVDKKGTVIRRTRGGTDDRLNRVVAVRKGLAIEGEWVDHADGDRLNNTRGNLRVVNPKQSAWNVRPKRRGKHPELPGGVSVTVTGKFQARCATDGRIRYIGQFDTAAEAGAAYYGFQLGRRGDFSFPAREEMVKPVVEREIEARSLIRRPLRGGGVRGTVVP
jgi:hypothetical protein